MGERVILNEATCTGLGICESIAPEYFEIDDDGRLILLRDDVTDADRAIVEEAVKGCPTASLRLAKEPG